MAVKQAFVLAAFLLGAGCTRAPKGEGAAEGESQPAPAVVALALQTPPDDAERSPSGLVSKVLKAGRGERRPQEHDKVRVDFAQYNGKGEVVDSSELRGEPTIFEITGVIAGFREALLNMRVGERRRLWVPDDLGYPGRPGYPRAPTVFEVELLEILEREAPDASPVAIERKPEPPRAPPDVAAVPKNALRTPSGLAYRMLRAGTGTARPKEHDRVEVHYSAWTTDGELFDSSYLRGKPASVPLRRLIPGWAEGLMRMTEGAQARLWIPEELAYGGRDGAPRGMLVYDVELVKIVR